MLEAKQLKRRPKAVDALEGARRERPTQEILYKDLDEPGLNTLKGYEKRGGYKMLRKALKMEPQQVLEEMLASNVRGRGGAGFAMGKKMSFIPKGAMDKYLVCNADESEPGTFKDRELMQKNPHQLIEGIIIGAYAIGANKSFIFIRGEYAHQADVLDAALAEARKKGYIGEKILGSDHTLDLVVHRGAGAYICGEETALLDSLEGKRGNPRLKPPFPAIQGLYRGPTLINNVETLMNVPYVLEMGGAEYAKIGTETSTGTKVVSISGCVQRPGNYEIELGTPSREIIFDLAGGPPEGRKVKAWFPGGSSAPVLTGSDEHLDLAYDFDTLAKAGSMLGSGAIIVVDDSVSIVDVALKTAKFYRHESCGKCTPCREGTNWTVKMLERVQSGEATPMDLDIMASVCEQIIGNCLCVLGDAMAMPIGSMIKHFRAEFEEHIEAARERNGLGAGDPAGQPRPQRRPRPDARARRHRPDRGGGLAVPRPDVQMVTFTIDGLEVQRPRQRDAGRRAPSTATSRSPSSATSPSSASPSARAACAWSRSRASRSCRPPARRRSRTAWSSTRRRSACTRRSARWSSSCSSTTRSTARSATRAASARCRTSPTAGARAPRASSSPSATSRSRSSSRR